MSEPSVFTKIIRGELPSHKIYEDERTLAFLDIMPTKPGHTLVIPKTEVDRLEDLEDEDYQAVMATTRKVMRRMIEVYGSDYRACLKVVGFDVPHVHVQVVPCRTGQDFLDHEPMAGAPDHAALAAVAEKLRFS